jgi:hypothetical protein
LGNFTPSAQRNCFVPTPWLASISLDAAVGGDVVQDPAQVIFIISKNPYSTKPTVGIEDCMISFFFVKPTVFIVEKLEMTIGLVLR